jgi:hypothetical protein
MTATKTAKAVSKTTTTATTKATAKGTKAASTVTTTSTDPAKARASRLAKALTIGEGMTAAEVGVTLAKVETAKEGATDRRTAAETAVKSAKEQEHEAAKALRDRQDLMVRLAAELNPTLAAPKAGRLSAKDPRVAVINAIVEETGQARATVQTRVARWVAAGSLYLSTGLGIGQAATTANTMLGSNGDAAAFWTIVESGVLPATASSAKTPARKTPAKTPAKVEVTFAAAAPVVKAHEDERVAKLTPAQRTADDLRIMLDAYGRIVDGIKAGTHAPLSRANSTKVETYLKALAS